MCRYVVLPVVEILVTNMIGIGLLADLFFEQCVENAMQIVSKIEITDYLEIYLPQKD
jgi:hypothetical protein